MINGQSCNGRPPQQTAQYALRNYHEQGTSAYHLPESSCQYFMWTCDAHVPDEETRFQPDLLIRRGVHSQTRIGIKSYMLWKQNLWRKGNTFFYLP